MGTWEEGGRIGSRGSRWEQGIRRAQEELGGRRGMRWEKGRRCEHGEQVGARQL